MTAVVWYDGAVAMGYIEADEPLTIKDCYLVKGIRGPSSFRPKEKRLRLGRVDPVVVSELLHDLTQLAANAT